MVRSPFTVRLSGFIVIITTDEFLVILKPPTVRLAFRLAEPTVPELLKSTVSLEVGRAPEDQLVVVAQLLVVPLQVTV